MSVYNYSKYKILLSPESKKKQGLRVGDVARRQYFDGGSPIYSLMVVLETGTDIIGDNESHYFIGALIEGDAPRNGEILDFVRVTNLFDLDRSGALYLTASDLEAPFMDVIDGMAFEKSLCFPVMYGAEVDAPNKNKYYVKGSGFIEGSYFPSLQGANRVLRLVRNGRQNPSEAVGLCQPIEGKPGHPERIVISYRIRSSKNKSNVPLTFGYLSGEEKDGSCVIEITTEWKYRLHTINIDYPAEYQRALMIDLTELLVNENDWCEIADLNIVLQSSIASYDNASKVRVGRIKGIIDPVFGVLEGYGAYFQNMYATKNVNIAGTLTAGDEKGFSSTFYVGKIHKNVILNSIVPEVTGEHTVIATEKNPVGIGEVLQAASDIFVRVQTGEWRGAHLEGLYCFSLWVKCSEADTVLSIYQNEHHMGDCMGWEGEWKRVHLSFIIQPSDQPELYIRIKCNHPAILFTAPQFEVGATPSQYQPTDGTLSYVEDYGAWFSKGGIGGTIQNPLLRLEEDGSICSKDKSFVISPDGTGHFAGGRFKWTKDTITLQDITIRWEDFDEETKENMQTRSVSLSGNNIFHYSDEFDINSCEPSELFIAATEHYFTSSDRKWQYLGFDSLWKNIEGESRDCIKIYPDSPMWEGRKTLSLRYTAFYKGEGISDIFTVYKNSDGQSAFTIYIHSSSGNIFTKGIVSTVLSVHVYRGMEEITNLIPDNNFKWERNSDDIDADTEWNAIDRSGKTLQITNEDVFNKAVFDCIVSILIS